jgi:hypothetical protein
VPQFLELPLPQVRRWARTIEQLCDLSDDFRARRIRQARQLLEMLRQQMPRRRSLQRSADENGALRWRCERDDVSSDDDSWSRP